MADASLGTATLKTRLDSTGLKAGFAAAKTDAASAGNAIQASANKIESGFKHAGNEVRAGLKPLREYRTELFKQQDELKKVATGLDKQSAEYKTTVARLAEVNRELATTGTRVEAVQTRFRALGGSLKRVGGILTLGITTPLIALGAVGVKSAAQLEQLDVAFSTILGSGEKAKTCSTACRRSRPAHHSSSRNSRTPRSPSPRSA